MLVCLILSQEFLRLSSILFILFPLFYSTVIISTILSSSLLIHSSDFFFKLLLVPSRVSLISVIVLFICLFILYFFYILGNCVELVTSCIFSILRIWNIFTNILNSFSDSLPISYLFSWSYVFLGFSFICMILLCLFISFF